eukprot:4485411-Amphidinium_carterae.1
MNARPLTPGFSRSTLQCYAHVTSEMVLLIAIEPSKCPTRLHTFRFWDERFGTLLVESILRKEKTLES